MVFLGYRKLAEISTFTEEIQFYAVHPICQNVNSMCYVSLLFSSSQSLLWAKIVQRPCLSAKEMKNCKKIKQMQYKFTDVLVLQPLSNSNFFFKKTFKCWEYEHQWAVQLKVQIYVFLLCSSEEPVVRKKLINYKVLQSIQSKTFTDK